MIRSYVRVNDMYTEEGITYEWRNTIKDFFKVISTEKDLVVTEPGRYTLSVRNTKDCSPLTDLSCSASSEFVVEGINFPN
ncbi:hypothetical protein SAMN05444128_0241 [Pontibacter indicus]|uniref:Uncharacterized protein n=2 Tax=Pontibacter indicus TaxID=1317125 RepID=A0A1R3WC50_9BACT|nr:hypothetical protein SAMN05444128_0241 [Pontibacter indicus]